MEKKQLVVSACSQLYPETVEAFKSIQKEQLELFCSKQMDYGPNNIAIGRDLSIDSNKMFSHQGLWFRMNDKISRIQNLLWNKKKGYNESLEDSWIDLANYSIIAMLVNRNKWGK
jgi:hypothetical protein|tara:strand:+ start:2372 stop:2716 length:345 start_codon:yes stop_codon:yes gene_type:complete